MIAAEFIVYWITYTVAAFGAAYVVGHSVISRPFRRALYESGGLISRLFVEMLECPMCFGFWTGAAAGLAAVFVFHVPPLAPLFAAFYTTGSNLIIGRATGLIPEEF